MVRQPSFLPLALASLLLATGPLVACDDVPDDIDVDAPDEEDEPDDEPSEDDEDETKEFTESTEYPTVQVTRIAHPLDHPWAVAQLDDDQFLVTERPGDLKFIDGGDIHDVDGAPDVYATNQGGLLDVVLHPDFDANNWVYLTYSKQEEDGSDTATAMARAEFNPDGPSLENLEDLYVQESYSEPGRHYGSRIAWLSDGTLLLTVGDRGAEPPRA